MAEAMCLTETSIIACAASSVERPSGAHVGVDGLGRSAAVKGEAGPERVGFR